MRLGLTALILVLLTGAASAQYTSDAKGRRYPLPDGRLVVHGAAAAGSTAEPLLGRGLTSDGPRRPAVLYVPCGSRCDLLDRMK